MAEVAVIGSGLNGLAAAYLLAKIGITVSVFESSTFGGNFKEDHRTSFISNKTLSLFEEFADKIRGKSGIIKYIYSYKNHRKPITELGNGQEGMGYVVDNSTLKGLLIESIKQNSNINIVEHTQIADILNNNSGVKINGTQFSLAVCASGANSSLHKTLGCTQSSTNYNQEALIFDVNHTKPHKNIAVEAFDECGVIAILPKAKENTSSVVLSLKNEYAAKLEDARVLEFLQAKTQRARSIGQITKITTPICRYPLASKHMKKQHTGNVFFIGDAFHVIHPVLGQGFNMSVKDVSKLCHSIAEAKKLGLPLNHCLKSQRNTINHLKMEIATRVFGQYFSSSNKLVDALTTCAVKFGEILPNKTAILQKLL